MRPLLKKIKQQFKNNPWIILKKPNLLPSIAFILLTSFLRRLKKSEATVYLTETKLSEIHFGFHIQNSTEGFQKLFLFEQFKPHAQKRILEDDTIDDGYYETIETRFKHGDFVILYHDNNNVPTTFVFVTTKIAVFTPVGMSLILPDLTFGLYDVYTFIDSRGQGLYTQLFYYTLNYMRLQGYEKIWLWFMPHNRISILVHKKLGLIKIIKTLTEKVGFGVIRRKITNEELNITALEKQ